MIIYQVKVVIQEAIEKEWLSWMRSTHVLDVYATGLVSTFQIWKADDQEQLIYYFNYSFHSRKELDQYLRDFASDLRAHPHRQFPNQFLASRQIFIQL